MIKNKTVVVVGAGASNDLGLPIGKGLQEQISDLVGNERNGMRKYLRSACVHHFLPDRERADRAFQRLSSLSEQLQSTASIDNFLDQHKDEPDLVVAGKMAIACAIAQAENSSSLNRKAERSGIVPSNKDYFLHPLLEIAARGHQFCNILESLKNITFVIFNYDRCVERYMEEWLRFRFGENSLSMQLRERFIHVYGSLGDYFDERSPNAFLDNGQYFSGNPHLVLPQYVDLIKIFTEQEDSETSERINHAINEAKAILFLGFGFEEQNMRFFERGHTSKSVFATTFGMSDENRQFIRRDLEFGFSKIYDAVHVVDGKCKKLFDDLYHPLTRAVGSL